MWNAGDTNNSFVWEEFTLAYATAIETTWTEPADNNPLAFAPKREQIYLKHAISIGQAHAVGQRKLVLAKQALDPRRRGWDVSKLPDQCTFGSPIFQVRAPGAVEPTDEAVEPSGPPVASSGGPC